MTLALEILILLVWAAVWAAAVIFSIIGRIVDYEKMINFSDIILTILLTFYFLKTISIT